MVAKGEGSRDDTSGGRRKTEGGGQRCCFCFPQSPGSSRVMVNCRHLTEILHSLPDSECQGSKTMLAMFNAVFPAFAQCLIHSRQPRINACLTDEYINGKHTDLRALGSLLPSC